MDLDLYRYFIGRADQSVNESIMVKRVDQQLRVTKHMIDCQDLDALKGEKKLRAYMLHYLSMMMAVSDIFLLLDGSAEAKEKQKGLWQYLREHTSAASTRAVVMTACKMPTVMACLPMLSRAERRNSLPMTKAMKPSATWVMMDRLSTCSRVPKPMPKLLRPRRPRKKGPSSRPASRYDVTAGKWIAFARRDIKRPAMSAAERQMRSCSMRYCGQQHDTDAQPPFPPFSQSGAFPCCLPKAQKTQHSNKLYYSTF